MLRHMNSASPSMGEAGAKRREGVISRTSTPIAEEGPEQRGGTAFLDASDHLWAVVAGRLLENARAMLDPTALRIVGAEIEPPQPREADGLRTHRAGL